jgi:hypothetical protein
VDGAEAGRAASHGSCEDTLTIAQAIETKLREETRRENDDEGDPPEPGTKRQVPE